MCRPIEARESLSTVGVGPTTSGFFSSFSSSSSSASPTSTSSKHVSAPTPSATSAKVLATMHTSSSSSSLLAPFVMEAASPTVNSFNATDGMNMLSMVAQPSPSGMPLVAFPKSVNSWAAAANDPLAFSLTDEAEDNQDIKSSLVSDTAELDASDLEQLLDFSMPEDPDSLEKDKEDLINLDDGFDGTEMSILYSFLVDTPQDKTVESKPVPTQTSATSTQGPAAAGSNQADDGVLNLNMLSTTPIESLMESLEEDFTDDELIIASTPSSATMLGGDPIKTKLAPEVKSRRLCKAEGCYKRSRSNGLCISHGGGRRCAVEGCDKSSQGGNLCIRHGGGKRCSFEGCDKAAQSNFLCKAHGGGPRCQVDGCTRSSQGGGYCRSHGGGKRCMFDGCTKGTQRGDYCALHGGSRLCEVPGCMRNDRGGGLCATHGGGKRCFIEGCGKPCRRKGLCSAHLRQSEHSNGTPTAAK